MHTDHREYAKYTRVSRLDLAINTVLGIVEGIAIDRALNAAEVAHLRAWLSEHLHVANLHPYSELWPVLQAALADGVLSSEEREDIRWLCRKLISADFYDAVTADMQRLHGVLRGVLADGVVSEAELRGLSEWIDEHDHLRTRWPYDEINSVVTQVLRDGKVDEDEHTMLRRFFADFGPPDDGGFVSPSFGGQPLIGGMCAVDPDVRLAGSVFCLTGASSRYSRRDFTAVIERLGGRVVTAVSRKLNYLVIGADGNPCWAYACYGRKVEAAVEHRKVGVPIVLLHEHDFHDAVAGL